MSLVPSKKNDQVFQLSLTELAFTLVFLLLLLAGLMVHHEKRSADGERRRAEQQRQVALAEQAKLREAVRTSQELSRLRDDSEKAVAELKALLPQSAVNPDAIISDLRKCSAKDTEIRRLQAAVADLEEKLTALVAVAALVKKAGADTAKATVGREVATALAFKKGYEDARNGPIQGGEGFDRGKSCGVSENRLSDLTKEAQNLRGQLTNMIKQAEGTKNSKGFGLPPCWVDESGKVQRLLDVEVTDGGLIVRAGWPPERNGDSKAVPGVEALTSTDSEETIAAFRGAADSVYAWSRGQDPECRHYASVTVSATKVQSAVTGKNAVYDYFYPYGREALAKP